MCLVLLLLPVIQLFSRCHWLLAENTGLSQTTKVYFSQFLFLWWIEMLLLLWLSFNYILKLPGSNLNVKSLLVMSCHVREASLTLNTRGSRKRPLHLMRETSRVRHFIWIKIQKKVTGSDHGVKTAQAVHWFCMIGLFSIASRRVL